jgi:hypothetical protein
MIKSRLTIWEEGPREKEEQKDEDDRVVLK